MYQKSQFVVKHYALPQMEGSGGAELGGKWSVNHVIAGCNTACLLTTQESRSPVASQCAKASKRTNSETKPQCRKINQHMFSIK